MSSCFFFFNDTATTEIYTLSLHDALPIYGRGGMKIRLPQLQMNDRAPQPFQLLRPRRSEEHTSELQSQSNLVCRLLLEKKETAQHTNPAILGIVGLPYRAPLPSLDQERAA